VQPLLPKLQTPGESRTENRWRSRRKRTSFATNQGKDNPTLSPLFRWMRGRYILKKDKLAQNNNFSDQENEQAVEINKITG